MLDIDKIHELCLRGESNCLDYKREQYAFIKAMPEEKSELIKDVLAMANADRSEAAYILIGVEEMSNKLGRVVGIHAHEIIDDALLHQFINQKTNAFSQPALAHLRAMRYVEGRGKQIRISSRIATMTEQKAEYIQMRATEDANLKRMVLDYLSHFGSASRKDIEKLLLGKMHEALTDDEKMTKVGNLLTSLRVHKKIENIGSRKKPQWVLFK